MICFIIFCKDPIFHYFRKNCKNTSEDTSVRRNACHAPPPHCLIFYLLVDACASLNPECKLINAIIITDKNEKKWVKHGYEKRTVAYLDDNNLDLYYLTFPTSVTSIQLMNQLQPESGITPRVKGRVWYTCTELLLLVI